MKHFSLRFRVFLFFVFLAVGSAAIMGGALWLGAKRAADGGNGYVIAALVAGFGVTGFVAGIWMLFDENVAKPIQRLATDLRARAQAGVEAELDGQSARYLGDLAPAAQALNVRAMNTAQSIAAAKADLEKQISQLSELFSQVPVATIMLSKAGRIVLYDQQAAGLLSAIAPPRLNASIADYFDRDALEAARIKLSDNVVSVPLVLCDAKGVEHPSASLKSIEGSKDYILMIEPKEVQPVASRPLTFDFAIRSADPRRRRRDTPLSELTFTVFDTETTGLEPARHELIQIGAVRVLRGKLLETEAFDHLIKPVKPIPAASTLVHHISDDMVADAPPALDVVRQFYGYASGTVALAHNAPFDLAFLNGVEDWPDIPVIDTVLISAILYGTTESHTLDDLCDRLHITIPAEARHTALGDALATAKVLCAAIPMLEAKGIVMLSDLQKEGKKHARLLKLEDERAED